VKALRPCGDKIEILSDEATLWLTSALVCAGVRSAPLLAPFGLRAPLQAVRGYHIEIPAGTVLFRRAVVYLDERVVVTPMSGRVRATSYMEFADADAPADARKPARPAPATTRARLCLRTRRPTAGWARDPVLPGLTCRGLAAPAGPSKLFYAIGHQHIGLTLAPITAELIADIVAMRAPRIPIAAYDLQRF